MVLFLAEVSKSKNDGRDSEGAEGPTESGSYEFERPVADAGLSQLPHHRDDPWRSGGGDGNRGRQTHSGSLGAVQAPEAGAQDEEDAGPEVASVEGGGIPEANPRVQVTPETGPGRKVIPKTEPGVKVTPQIASTTRAPEPKHGGAPQHKPETGRISENH